MAKLLLRVLGGETVWPPPVWLMRQAGRYLPEYRAVRARAGDFVSLCLTPELAAEVTLQPVRRFGLDGAILFSDILMVPSAQGRELRFVDGEGPLLVPLEGEAAVAALQPQAVAERLAPVLETVRRVRQAVGEATLIGFAGAPFTVACYMVEGGASKDFARIRLMAYRQPELLKQLIAVLTAATIDYLEGQIAAGAEAVMLFDSWAGVLAPALFRAHVIAPAAAIAATLRRRHPEVPVIGFPRLAGMMLGEYARMSGMQGIGVDTAAEPRLAAAALPPAVAFQGNLDPLALAAGGAALAEAAHAILSAMRGRPFIFNLGHGIVPQTPAEHVAELVRLVRQA
jgi:uroporphyrinogen decarboxylase